MRQLYSEFCEARRGETWRGPVDMAEYPAIIVILMISTDIIVVNSGSIIGYINDNNRG